MAKSMPIRIAQGLRPGASEKKPSGSDNSSYKKPSSKKKPKKQK